MAIENEEGNVTNQELLETKQKEKQGGGFANDFLQNLAKVSASKKKSTDVIQRDSRTISLADDGEEEKVGGNPNVLNVYENSMVMGTDGLYDTQDNMLRQDVIGDVHVGDQGIEIQDDELRSQRLSVRSNTEKGSARRKS